MDRTRNRYRAVLIIDFAVIFLTLVSVCHLIVGKKAAFMGNGAAAFRYYTTDSNILCALALLCALPYDVSALKKGYSSELPPAVFSLLLMGTASVALTLVTVLVFLGPVFGMWAMFRSISLMSMHLITPLAALISFCLLRDRYRGSRWAVVLGAAPTAIYICIYYYFVIYSRKWPDFYAFTFFGNNAAVIAVMLCAILLITFSVFMINIKRNDSRNTYKEIR